jgi:hypothetical protein
MDQLLAVRRRIGDVSSAGMGPAGGRGLPGGGGGLGIVSVFLLVSKVHSPQFALWIIPLVAMLSVPWRYVLFYMAADLGVFVSGFYYFTVINWSAPGWMGIFEFAVWARALAGLAAAAWSAERANADDKTPLQPEPITTSGPSQ